MWIVIVLIFHILGFLSSINAVMTVRTSQGAIAWAVSLNAMPYIAVPAYWVLGRSKFDGYSTARQSSDDKIQENLKLLYDGLKDFSILSSELKPASIAAQKLTDIPYLKGNDVKLLVDGDATFGSIIEGIDEAQDYILFQFFIVKDDEIGRKVKKHLIAKAKDGVKIYFLYDEVGSIDLPDSYKNELRKVGIEVHDFHTQKGKDNRFQLNFRNHRKLVVVDGKKAWIGGSNVGDEYLGKDPKFGHWRDTHVCIEGPAVISAQISFVEDWFWAIGEFIKTITWKPTASKTSNKEVIIIPSGPADELETATLMFLQAINSAKERIWIASPYFVPDDSIIDAIQLAGLRGVDVRILIPDKKDHLAVWLAAFTYFDEASLTGARIYRYMDGFLHEKVMLIDYYHSSVGTANFDNRSMRLNFEITAMVSDREFNAQVEKMFLADFEKAIEIKKGLLDSKPFYFRVGANIARLTAPIQ